RNGVATIGAGDVGADFDGAPLHGGAPGGPLHGFVHVGSLDDEVAAKLLAGLGIGAVMHLELAALVDEAAVALDDLAALDAQRPRLPGALESGGGDIGAGLGQCLLIGVHGVHGAGHVLGGDFGAGPLVGVE